MKRLLLVLFLLALTVPAQASIIAVDLGTAQPPLSMGGFPITSWGTSFTGGTSQAGPGGLSLGFSVSMTSIFVSPFTMPGWSHLYAGDALSTGGATSVLMTFSSPVDAFVFYIAPDVFSEMVMTGTAQDGTTLSVVANGINGADGMGFYGTGGSQIVSILASSSAGVIIEPADVKASSSAGFFIGEFSTSAVSAPEPSSLLLVFVGLGCLVGFSRKAQIQ